ncbi:MAG TPA: hypothetical protein DD001_14765 [Microcoleaceae bacterium UBA10368]|nr:hypothetical protein [Microcoleaceae cyanobacterium UBA10368]HCV29974.1 hypothetical protein [Microcoleaceae cyanobacterium UBA9251]
MLNKYLLIYSHNTLLLCLSKTYSNKCRKAGGVYLPLEDLRLALEEAYPQAINEASLEVEEGRYDAKELETLVNEEEVINRAFSLISI